MLVSGSMGQHLFESSATWLRRPSCWRRPCPGIEASYVTWRVEAVESGHDWWRSMALRIQVCPKKETISTILFWGWDLDHQSYSRQRSGFLGCYFRTWLENPEIFSHKKMHLQNIFCFNAIRFDGSEIRLSPVEVGSFSHYLQGFSPIPGGDRWISSMKSITLPEGKFWENSNQPTVAWCYLYWPHVRSEAFPPLFGLFWLWEALATNRYTILG